MRKYKTPDISGMYDIDYMPRKGKKEEIMTREEAIKYLYSSGMSDEQVNAVVKALEQEPCEECEHINPCMYCEHTFKEKGASDTEQEPCDDAISREEAIHCITESELGQETFTDAKYRIRELPPVQPVSKWIPVSERLPKKNVEVLITTEWDGITIGEMFSNNDWFIHEGATNADIDDIKAWMPLPEPYKEAEE